MDTQRLHDFVDKMDAKKFVQIHDDSFHNYYLNYPNDFEDYISQQGLCDLQELFSEIDGPGLIVQKIGEYLTTLNHDDKVKFFYNEFTIEEINLELSCDADDKLYERFADFYYYEPWSALAYEVFMYQIHKEFIADKIEQRDKQIEKVFND